MKMATIEFNREHNSLISQKALFGVKKAAGNLSRYGELVRNGESPTFHKIAATNNILEITTVSIADRPTHVSTGEISLPQNDIRRKGFGSNMIFFPTEIGSAESINLEGDLIVPSIVFRWIGKSTCCGSSTNKSMIDDTVLSQDGRIFRGLSFEPHERPVHLAEFTTDFEAEQTTFSLETCQKTVAAAYPDVKLDR